MKVLLIDIDDTRVNKIDPILDWAGIELVNINDHNTDIYQLVGAMHPEIILVDTNSPNRDTLEHLVQLDQSSPRTVIKLGKKQSESINRLAAEAGISLYAIDDIPPVLLQSLIDITLSYFYSIDRLKTEVQALKPEIDARQTLNNAKKFITETYGLTDEQAKDLLSKNADRQGRPIAEVARQLVETGSFI
ncbi:Chemotaxis response regulator protein-glutamate methylesterase [Zhongshania aliphaticivorans]|uniref:Chemotaxis response regulator protein-glutamate methylesterase n=1 Tax=Zhongshania aliphaticivorans TaxID=1470434 RepID=A0A5S9NHE6_9GAMM|nr:ANTAR domain-containing protein [Zhongshania aliphaticivorans]CAA0089947.1 Chemotaxis response regulator protein-glutamate methylesterase [Zhongshania aliphaticivorans]CAA0097095.1 Chemotaxis response regulator protein-glutamate methylesterase [Zhongshania aliphaticivorans]